MKREVTNVAASVHARLLNLAKAEGRPFNELLQYYTMERFLYRLSCSEHADHFVLKGGLMLQFWGGTLTRSTKDIDLLGRATSSPDELVDIVRSCLTLDVEDDGLYFDPGHVRSEEIRLAAHYVGVRIRCGAGLGNARVSLQVDVGFGDIITPSAQEIDYPGLLNFNAPRLLGYTPESAIAEKLEAMVVLDMANTRMKDFLDIWTLAQGRSFSGDLLGQAIEATFRRRQTPLPESTPLALTPVFHSAAEKQTQWRAYLRKGRIQGDVPALTEVALQIETFVMPVIRAFSAKQVPMRHWPAGGPWRDGAAEAS